MLPNSKKHNVFKMANRNKILLAVLVALAIAAAVLAEVKINFKGNSGEEKAQAFSYDYFYDEDSYVDGTDNVRFSAYFMKDVYNNGNVRKVISSLSEIGQSDTLYLQVDVYNEGYLKNGKIQINGKNFYLATNLYQDDEIKDNYIGINTNEIEFNNLPSGTSKSVEAEIRSGDYSSTSTMRDAIGNDEDNMRNYENNVVFTGTYVDGEGNEIEIKKEFELDVCWYGDVTASIKDTNQVYSNLSEMIDEENDCIKFRFKVTTEELNKQLTLQKNRTQIRIPSFNGYSAINAKCLSPVDYSYYYETPEMPNIQSANNIVGVLTFERMAKIADEGELQTKNSFTSKLSTLNVYEIEVEYPLDAYKNMDGNVVNLNFNVNTNYKGYSLWTKDGNSGDVTSETVSADIIVTYEDIQTVDESDLGIEIGKNGVSKKPVLEAYAGMSTTNDDMNYVVTWKASVDKDGLNNKIVMSDDGAADEFIKQDLSSENMENQTFYEAVEVLNAEKVLGEDGWINVYDSESNDLIETISKSGWGREYKYNVSARHIRIETSNVISTDVPLYIYNIKAVSINAITEKYSKSEFDMLTKISSTVAGSIGNKVVSAKVATADFVAPLNTMDAELSDKTVLADGNKKNLTLSLKTTNDEFMNKQALINAGYVIKLPKEFKNLIVNDIDVDNDNVHVRPYSVFEKDGFEFIKIDVLNYWDYSDSTYTLNIDMDVIPVADSTVDSLIEIYYSTDEIGEYEAIAVDEYDANYNADTVEYVGKKNVDITIKNDDEIAVIQKVNNVESVADTEITPKYGDEEKNVNIKVDVKNNGATEITGVKLVGRIPYEGNKYVVSEQNMESKYSTSFTNEGIVIPDELKGKVTIYYSENIDAGAEIISTKNGWIEANKIENLENIKSFLIDFGNTAIQSKESYSFEYDVNIPGIEYLNKTSYAGASVYYTKNVNGEKQKSQVDGRKIGIKLVETFDVNLVEHEVDTAIGIPNSVYSFYDRNTARFLTTDENGEGHLKLYAGYYYYIYYIFGNDEYEYANMRLYFKVDVDEDGNLDLVDANYYELFEFDETTKTLKISLENMVKGKIEIDLVDKDTNLPISNAEFRMDHEYYKTDENGHLIINKLYPYSSKFYTITEINANGYNVVNSISFNISVTNGEYSISQISDNIQDASINNDNGLVANIKLENEKKKTFDLRVTAIGETDDITDESTYSYLPNMKFGLYENNRLIDIYTTDQDGKLTIPNLYEYVDGQPNNPEYILRAAVVPDGYSKLDNIGFYVTRGSDGNLIFTGYGKDFYYTANDNEINLVLENYEYHKLVNIDKDTQSPIAGAKFMIVEASTNKMAVKSDGTYWGQKENINGENLYVGTTDENGELLLDLPEKEYRAVQVNGDVKYEFIDEKIRLGSEGSMQSKDIFLVSSVKNFNIDVSIDANDPTALGTITNSNEVVKYGADSVNEHKVIPKSGYEIINVSINDIEQEIKLNDDGSYTVPTFNNVTESKNVVVTIVDSNKRLTIKAVDAETNAPVEGVGIAMPKNLTKELVGNGSYYFVEDASGNYIPTNGKTYRSSHGYSSGVSNSNAYSYVKIDLTKEQSDKQVMVRAECSSESGNDIGFATILYGNYMPSYTSSYGRFMYTSGKTSTTRYYSQRLYAGSIYYLYIGYHKNGSNDINDDQIVVKEIQLLDYSTGNARLDSELTTNKVGKINYQLENNSYEFYITKLPKGYSVENNKFTVMHTSSSEKEIVVRLNRMKEVVVHHYLEGTTTKIADDEILYGNLNEKYSAKAKNDLSGYELIKDVDGNYVFPDNRTGVFTNDDQEVTFYYKANKAEVIVRHCIEGTETAVPLADGTLAIEEKTEYDMEENYTTSAIPEEQLNKYYRLAYVDGDESGTISNAKTVVTYYYARPTQTLNVNKYAEDGKTPLKDAIFSVVSKSEYENPVQISDMFRGILPESQPVSLQSSSEYVESQYYFVKDGDRYISNNHVKESQAIGYVRIDLTDATSKVLVINAQMLGSLGMDYAYVSVYSVSEQQMCGGAEMTSAEAQNYGFYLQSGSIYYIEFVYEKNSAKTDDLEDVLAINSMRLENAEILKTDENGKAKVLLPANDYVLIEEEAPYGYDKNDEPISVEIGKDASKNVDVINNIGNGKVIVHYYAEGTREKVAEDKIITGKIGNYYDTEGLTQIGDSYELSSIPNNKYGTIKVEDTEVIYYYRANKFNLTINKTQKDSDIKIEGVKYEIIDNNEVKVDTTDVNGQINITGLELEQEYRLIEMSAPEGYSLIRNEIKFKLGYKDGNLVCTIENGEISSKVVYEDTPRLELNIQNEPLFELTKTSEDGVKLLPDAKFVIKELVDNNGTTVENDAVDYAGNLLGTEEDINGQTLRVVTTDENGKIGIALKKGKYKVTEVQAPKGYTIGDESTQYFEITDDTIKDVNFEELFYHDALSGLDIDSGYVKLKDGSYIAVGGFYDQLGIPGQRINESDELEQVTVDGKDIWLKTEGYENNQSGYKNGYVMKINPEGKVEWAEIFGYGEYFHITDVIATSDGGFVFAGENQGYMYWPDNRLNINSYTYNNGIFATKFNKDGICEWTTGFENRYDAYIYNYQILEDNNEDYLLYGFTNDDFIIYGYDTINGEQLQVEGNESYLIKISKDDGKVYWATSIIGECYGKIVKADSDYLLHVISETEYDEDLYAKNVAPNPGKNFDELGDYPGEYIVRVSSAGVVKSTIPYEYVDFSDEFEYVTEQTAKDGGRLIIGNIRESFTIPAESTTSGKDINVKVFGKVTGVVLKTNMNGKVEWVRTLASDECENMFLQVAPTENNGCIVAGMFAGKLDVVYYDGDVPYVKTYETEKHAINLVFLNYDSNGTILNVDGSRMIRYDGTYEDDEIDISVEDKFTEGVLAEYPIDFDVNSINDLGDGYYEVCLMGYEYSFVPIWNDDDTIETPSGYYSTGKLVRNIVYKAVETPAKVAEKQEIKMKNTAKSFTIKTRVEGDGGMITGEDQPVFEIVNEGEDSKKVIKIMPDKLHYIKKITVNGVAIDFEINEEDGTYILKGFTNMEEDKEIVVTFGTYDSEIIVHHYKEGTTEKLHDDVIIKGGEGEQYTTEPIQELLEKYDLISTPDNATGEFIKGQTEIFYYYRLKDTDDNVKIVVKYLDKSSGNEVADSETITGIKGDEYTTKEKEVDGFKLKEVPENAKGTMTEDIEVIYYYLRPAKVIVNYIDTETGDELAEPEIIEGYQDDEYTTEEKKFDYYKLIKSPTNAKGTMEVKVSKDEDGEEVIDDEINVDYYYNKQTFNLKIKKDVSSAIVNGVSNDMYNGLSKIEIARKAVNSTNIQVVYKITVINDGDLTGKGTIQEQIPAGMEFVADANSEWKLDGKTATLETKELAAGEQAEYTVTMNWAKSSENIGTKRNTVKIISTENEAGFEEKDTKDNTAYADIVIAISTGANSYMNIAGGVLLVMIALACGVYVVKKVDEE